MTPDDTVAWVWGRQSVWSQTANHLKSGITRARWGTLLLTIAVAALGLASSQIIGSHRPLGVGLSVAAAVCAVALVLMTATQGKDRVARWVQARSVSEALKADVYVYLSGVGADDGATRAQKLEADANRVISSASGLAAVAAPYVPLERERPPVSDLASYLDVRVETSQLKAYYRPKAAQLSTRLTWSKWMIVALSGVAAALGALAVVSKDLAAWTAVTSAAIGAVGAFIAGERWEFLQAEYSRTAQELDRLKTRQVDAHGSALSPEALVAQCEEVISVQNQTWMANWGSDPSDG